MSLSDAQKALLAKRLQARRPAAQQPIPVGGDGPAPLSAEQEQILLHGIFSPAPIYNEAITVAASGDVDVDAFRAAFNGIVERHRIWRSVIKRQGGQFVQVPQPFSPLPMELLDLSQLSPAEADAEFLDRFTAIAGAAYDLRNGPLVRPLLVRYAADDVRLHVAMHHIVFDGVSLYRVVLPELIALYEGRELPPPAVQYSDYARWERSGAVDDDLAKHLPWWRERLGDAPMLALRTDRPRPAEQRQRGAMTSFTVPATLVDGLNLLAHVTGGTLFHVVLAAFSLLLQELSDGQEDLVFATVADLRRRRELETMVGYCLTPLVLRVNVPVEAPFADVVGAARGSLLDALTHLLPWEPIVRDLNPPRVLGADPVFQAMLVLEPPGVDPHPDWRLHQLDARIGDRLGHIKTDFLIELDQRPDGELAGRCAFNVDLWERDFGARIGEQFLALLQRLVASETITPG